uniref:BACK domain-containing protein n=1 Tax=Mesocestoides corti TaxID=53468 RepID=A0A5K3G4X5_MESCO
MLSICVPLIADNFESVVSLLPSRHSSLELEILATVLRDVRLIGVPACWKLRAIVRWLGSGSTATGNDVEEEEEQDEEVDDGARVDILKDVIASVDLSTISVKDFIGLTTYDCWMNLSKECRDVVVNAWMAWRALYH